MEKQGLTTKQKLIIAGAALFQLAYVGILPNCIGVIMAALKADVGISVAQISVFNTIKSICEAVFAVPFTALVFKFGYRKSMFLFPGIMSIGYIILIFFVDTPLFYGIPLLICSVASVGAMIVPYLLNQAIPGKSGTALGIAMAFSGIGGMLFNPVAAWLIEKYGWKICILVFAFLTMALITISSFMVFRLKAEAAADTLADTDTEKGSLKPFDSGQLIAFILCCIVVLGGCMGRQQLDNVSLHAASLDYDLKTGALLTSLAMIGNFGGKFLVGWLIDHIGFWKSIALNSLAVCVGSLGMALFGKNLTLLYISALLFGTAYVIPAIGPSRCAIAMFGSQRGKKYSGFLTMFSSAMRALTAIAAGSMYEMSGNFNSIFVLIAAFSLVSSAAAFVCKKRPA